MGTLKTRLDRVRLRAKDIEKIKFTDDQMVSLANDVQERIFKYLSALESNLVLTQSSFDTVISQSEYTLATSTGLVFDSLWENDPLQPLAKATQLPVDSYEGAPDRYIEKATGVVELYPTPGDVRTFNYQYYAKPVDFTDYNVDDIPFLGIWDEALERAMVVEVFEILERDISRVAMLSQDAWDYATQQTMNRGVMRRMVKGSYIGMQYEL